MDTEKYKKLFGKIIRQERERQGLTQDALSGMIDLDPANLSYIETGKRSPSFPTICSIITNLKFEPNELFSFLPFCEADKDLLDVELYESIKPLSSDTKKSLLNIVKKLTK